MGLNKINAIPVGPCLGRTVRYLRYRADVFSELELMCSVSVDLSSLEFSGYSPYSSTTTLRDRVVHAQGPNRTDRHILSPRRQHHHTRFTATTAGPWALHRHHYPRSDACYSSCGRQPRRMRMSAQGGEPADAAGHGESVDRAAFLRDSAAALLLAGSSGGLLLATTAAVPGSANAIGDLYEFKDQARFAQHATIQVSDMDAAVKFWTEGVGMEVLRKRSTSMSETVVVGFGPEALEKPPDFRPGVSSFLAYGGHFSLELNAQKVGGAGSTDEDAQVFYEPGNGVQYLQIAVDAYRISTVIKAGGIVESGYGHLQILAPGGLRLKLMSGMRRDPPMFVAVKVNNLARSVKWYTDVAGMTKMPYPRARAPGSPFEPEQPKDSVFMAYEGEAFGVVLVPTGRGETIIPGGVFSLAVLADGVEDIAAELGVPVSRNGGKGKTRFVSVSDPDGYAVKIVEFSDWRKELPPFQRQG